MKNITFDLREIPTSITLAKNVYVLCGIIEFVPPVIPPGMGHYISYCRKLNNTWYVCNDLHKSKKNLTAGQLSNKKISMIFYAKCKSV